MRWIRDVASGRPDLSANVGRMVDPHHGPMLESMVRWLGKERGYIELLHCIAIQAVKST